MHFEESRFDKFFTRINANSLQAKSEIMLEEYKVSASIVGKKSEDFNKIVQFFITLLAAVSAIFAYYLSQNQSNIKTQLLNIESINFTNQSVTIIISNLITIFLIQLTTSYLKEIYYHSLKMVIIRKNLGLSYGVFTSLISDNHTYIGVDDPFKIRLFPGWITYESTFLIFICLINAIICSTIINTCEEYTAVIFLTLFIFMLVLYRFLCLEKDESLLFTILKYAFNNLLNLKLENNFSWPIYKAKLNSNEVERLKIKTDHLITLLIFIEDKDFYHHCGISLKSFPRIILYFLKNKKLIGGSTISQQLFRSLFVIEYNKTFRRKLAELCFTPVWLEQYFTKNEILHLYLASVRFEKGVIGIPSAIKYFNMNGKKLSKAESFFLIERIANINSKILPQRICLLIKKLIDTKIISKDDAKEIYLIFRKQKLANRINCDDCNLENLKTRIQSVINEH